MKRLWRKVRVGVDEATLEVRAAEVTRSNIGDAPKFPSRLDKNPPDEGIASVAGDAVYDTRRCHDAISARCAHAGIPLASASIQDPFCGRARSRPWRETSAAKVQSVMSASPGPRASPPLARPLASPLDRSVPGMRKCKSHRAYAAKNDGLNSLTFNSLQREFQFLGGARLNFQLKEFLLPRASCACCLGAHSFLTGIARSRAARLV